MSSCQDASFDLFSRPPTEMGLQEFHDQEILPLTALSSSSAGSIDFSISGEGDEYTDLSDLRLFVRVKIQSSDGKAIEKDDAVSLVKHWPSSLFRQCDLFLNGTLVTTSSNLYNYVAYVSSLLSYTGSVKQNQLDVLEHANGWKVKKDLPENEALIKLHLPLCNQQRLLPNGVNIKLRLLRSANEFLCIRDKSADTNYTVSLEKCSLFVRRVTPSPTVLLQHAETLTKLNMIYPIERLYPKFFTPGKDVREFDLPNISQGQLPSRVVVGFVKTSAFSGTWEEDPYKFHHFDLDYISLQSNGRAIPAVPITTDYSKNFCRRAYYSLLDTIQGPCIDNESLGLTLEEYKQNSCFYAFTLSRAMTGPSEALPRRENGYVNAKIRFKDALKENINAIFFLEYHNFVEIDSAKNIYLDYAA